MLVKELIKALQDEDEEAIVVFSYDYGDHGHTPAVEHIRHIKVCDLTTTGYSPSGLRIVEDDDYVPEPAAEDVVVLS